MDYLPEKQKRIHEVIQETTPFLSNDSLVTGWVLVYEAMKPDGTKTLVHATSEGLDGWTVNGFLFSALHSEFDNQEVE